MDTAHFTKDRTWKGTDHAASLRPAGLSKLCRDLKAAWCPQRQEDGHHPERATRRQAQVGLLQRVGFMSLDQRAVYDSPRAPVLVDVRRTLRTSTKPLRRCPPRGVASAVGTRKRPASRRLRIYDDAGACRTRPNAHRTQQSSWTRAWGLPPAPRPNPNEPRICAHGCPSFVRRRPARRPAVEAETASSVLNRAVALAPAEVQLRRHRRSWRRGRHRGRR